MKNIILYLFIGMIALTSCTEKINLELDSSYTRIVVEGNFSTDYKYQTIKLTKTSSYFYDEEPPPLSGATVSVDNGDTTFIFNESPMGSGIYLSITKTSAVVGKTYTLHISNVNIDNAANYYQASTTVKQALYLDSITADQPSEDEINQYKLDPNKSWRIVRIWGQEPATPGDCYEWDYYINGILKTDTIYKSVFLDDQLINGNYIQGKTIFIINANPEDTITVSTQSITKDYLDFVISLITESSGGVSPLSGGPLSNGPPANVPSNINNGALGYFKATAITYNSIIVE